MTDQAPETVTKDAEPDMPEVDQRIDLRALLQQRVETKMRRIHRQWFCLDVQLQSDLDEAVAHLAELVGREVQMQQLRPEGASRKYNVPTAIQAAQQRVDDLRARSRQSGVMGVFANLTDAQLDEALAHEDPFEKARTILSLAWMRWEDADGHTIPSDQLGREDLDLLLQREVLERGEWLPLAATISGESQQVINRPT